jgi:hypothetical protein
MFFSFISACSSRRYDPTHISSECADNDQFQIVEKTVHLVAHFTFSIRTMSDHRTLEEEAQFFEVDASFSLDVLALFFIPPERTDLCEQSIKIFRHSEAPQESGCDTSVSTKGSL